MCLIPSVVEAVDIPVIAAGGLYDGKSMLAAMVLGAEGVQMGSRFVPTEESSAHIAFKNAVVEAGEGATTLTLKELTPVGRNELYKKLCSVSDRRLRRSSQRFLEEEGQEGDVRGIL